MANKQSVTISFSSSSLDDIYLSIELDDVVNEEVLGKTSGFVFGESVAFKVYVYPFSTALLLTSTDGSIDGGATNSENIENEIVTFAEPSEEYGGEVENVSASLSYPCGGTPTITLIAGTGVGVVNLDPDDSTKIVGSSCGLGIYAVSYGTQYLSYTLSGVNAPSNWPLEGMETDEPYPVTVLVTGV